MLNIYQEENKNVCRRNVESDLTADPGCIIFRASDEQVESTVDDKGEANLG